MHLIFRSLPVLLTALYFCVVTKAQPVVCLSKDPETHATDFKPGELTSYLHPEKYKAIFFGEQHNAIFDPEIKYQLITDANKSSGIRHVFMETGVSRAWHYNLYLQTGDTSYLYNSSAGYSHNRYKLFWTKLYDYNKTLPDNAKIVIHGVDFERTDVFSTLKQLAPDGTPVPASLRAVMDTVNAHESDPQLSMWNMTNNKFELTDNSGFIKTLRYVQAQFSAHLDDTKAYFGVNFPVVEDIITNKGRVEVRANHRNKTMFAAMRKAIDEQHIDRFIGFFGNAHTTYSAGNSLSNAAKRLTGFDERDILNICEMAYDLKSPNTAYRIKHFDEVVALNGSCHATLLPAREVPGFKGDADFVVIANIGE